MNKGNCEENSMEKIGYQTERESSLMMQRMYPVQRMHTFGCEQKKTAIAF